MAGSRAMQVREPGQIRKEAALSGPCRRSGQTRAGAAAGESSPRARHEGGCTVRLFARDTDD